MSSAPLRHALLPSLALIGLAACQPDPEPELAEDIYGPMGTILPTATAEQQATFERGQQIATRRFAPDEGLGPLVNVSFCTSCHERPVFGGSGPRYRDFFLTGTELDDGSFLATGHGGVVTSFGFNGAPTRPGLDEGVNVIAHRNAIPFFGTGLIAELSESSILANADEDDADGDGISGRPNWDRGFVGRFGRKSQTVSIEGFIRGPLNNHLGITTDPLTEAQKAALPVPSSAADSALRAIDPEAALAFRQAAAPDEPLFDDDDTPDPEMPSEDLFDLVSFAMLLAAPEPEDLGDNELGLRGQANFAEIGCDDCHAPTLEGPRGLVPLYSDLLLHDMGEAMADGMQQGVATGAEFRTQPLWGIVAVAPYLHDGRADTLDEAILWHGGEAQRSRDAYEALPQSERDALLEFLASLGGREQFSEGLLPADAVIPPTGTPGCPEPEIHANEAMLAQWQAGRALFDRDADIVDGLGPTFNGDSCRACHFDPVIGGAGPIDLNVMRHGTIDMEGEFIAPDYGTILHRLAIPGAERPEHDPSQNVFETRQTPSLLGLGRVEGIADDDILANADPDDLDGDGIRGVAHLLPDGRLGRFGWKAQVPSLREFARDALSAEMGLTVPEEDSFSYGLLSDGDDIPDPEVDTAYINSLTTFMAGLAAPEPAAELPEGLAVFESVGCDGCHVVELPGVSGPVRAYSDFLLHVVAPEGAVGIVDFAAEQLMFRTAPLWGLRLSAPYMHDGSADTVEAAILAHDGEAQAVRVAFEGLSDDDRVLLLSFLESL
ncbi:di-heme oxidoredictase family protein [Pseudenhygromyxa sp. WMMC2535]|uniref:di-heme oxidoredictase family protein n=1 Tax=Pseudenhygromyxa sp. WMMC2535 TaxID=2712867 RepID=UPI0020D020CE|nr:di-heme oxidoredictase family protein [Pseudenhygromyxa sp. WMMC2535]